jgi:hypothetical protein
MKDHIGTIAGRIWQALHGRERVSLTQLPKLVDEREPVVYQALGWLAREDKVTYESEGKSTYVSLR